MDIRKVIDRLLKKETTVWDEHARIQEILQTYFNQESPVDKETAIEDIAFSFDLDRAGAEYYYNEAKEIFDKQEGKGGRVNYGN